MSLLKDYMINSVMGGGGSSGGGFTTVTINVDPNTYAMTCALTFDEVFNLICKEPVYFRICVGEGQSTGSFNCFTYTNNGIRTVGFEQNRRGFVNGQYFTEDGKWLVAKNSSSFGNITETDSGQTVTWGATA